MANHSGTFKVVKVDTRKLCADLQLIDGQDGKPCAPFTLMCVPFTLLRYDKK